MTTEWILHNFKKNRLECQRCGSTHKMPDEAIDIRMFAGIINSFLKIHKICRKNPHT